MRHAVDKEKHNREFQKEKLKVIIDEKLKELTRFELNCRNIFNIRLSHQLESLQKVQQEQNGVIDFLGSR